MIKFFKSLFAPKSPRLADLDPKQMDQLTADICADIHAMGERIRAKIREDFIPIHAQCDQIGQNLARKFNEALDQRLAADIEHMTKISREAVDNHYSKR